MYFFFDENQFDAVIHYAGLKSVGESVAKPLEYYHNNMTGTFISWMDAPSQLQEYHLLKFCYRLW